jgi:hypothetical protein
MGRYTLLLGPMLMAPNDAKKQIHPTQLSCRAIWLPWKAASFTPRSSEPATAACFIGKGMEALHAFP